MTRPIEPPPRIVFFDGVCALCNRTVDYLLGQDPEGRLLFAPLQGETAAELRRAYPDRFQTHLDSLVYVEREGEGVEISTRSEAVLRLAACLGIGGIWVGLLSKLPRILRDPLYVLVARTRFLLFGRRDSCRVPAPEERDRFLP